MSFSERTTTGASGINSSGSNKSACDASGSDSEDCARAGRAALNRNASVTLTKRNELQTRGLMALRSDARN